MAILQVLKSTDNGVTWSVLALTTHYTLNSTTNEITFVTAPLATDKIRVEYTSHTDMAEPAVYGTPLLNGTQVSTITDKASAALMQSLIGKVTVGAEVQKLTFTSDSSHVATTVIEASPTAKMKAEITRDNGRAQLQITGKEIKWNTGVIGDNGKLENVSNVATVSDDNADKVLAFNKLIPLPYFIDEAE